MQIHHRWDHSAIARTNRRENSTERRSMIQMKVFEIFCFRKRDHMFFYCRFVVRCSHNASFFQFHSPHFVAFCPVHSIVCRTRRNVYFPLHRANRKSISFHFVRLLVSVRISRTHLLVFSLVRLLYMSCQPHHKITQIPFLA